MKRDKLFRLSLAILFLWTSFALAAPAAMAAILKIRSMSIHIPPIFHQRQRMAAASPAANPSLWLNSSCGRACSCACCKNSVKRS